MESLRPKLSSFAAPYGTAILPDQAVFDAAQGKAESGAMLDHRPFRRTREAVWRQMTEGFRAWAGERLPS